MSWTQEKKNKPRVQRSVEIYTMGQVENGTHRYPIFPSIIRHDTILHSEQVILKSNFSLFNWYRHQQLPWTLNNDYVVNKFLPFE